MVDALCAMSQSERAAVAKRYRRLHAEIDAMVAVMCVALSQAMQALGRSPTATPSAPNDIERAALLGHARAKSDALRCSIRQHVVATQNALLRLDPWTAADVRKPTTFEGLVVQLHTATAQKLAQLEHADSAAGYPAAELAAQPCDWMQSRLFRQSDRANRHLASNIRCA